MEYLLDRLNQGLTEAGLYIKQGQVSIIDASVITTAGNVHDSQCLEALLTGTEEAVYADSAYTSHKHDALLNEKHIKNGILKRDYRNKTLTQAEKQRNKQLSSIRSTVERVFGILKNTMAWVRLDT